jgi:hypothetical protein
VRRWKRGRKRGQVSVLLRKPTKKYKFFFYPNSTTILPTPRGLRGYISLETEEILWL